jgi:DNA-binding CsgD family transcriptional regulator
MDNASNDPGMPRKGISELVERIGPCGNMRENEVARKTCFGLSAALIDKRLGVSRRTVESQPLNVYRKIGVDPKKELVVKVSDSLSRTTGPESWPMGRSLGAGMSLALRR